MSDFTITIDRATGLRLLITPVDSYRNFHLLDADDHTLVGVLGYGQPLQLQRGQEAGTGGWLHVGTSVFRIADDDALLAIADHLGL